MNKEELQQFAVENNLPMHWVDEMFTLCKEELIEQLIMAISSLQMAMQEVAAKKISNEIGEKEIRRLKMFQWRTDDSIN
jgi:hypothetical protein